jgi:ankyrin repeat protein
MSEVKQIERLVQSARDGALDAVLQLLDSGIPVDAQDRNGNRAINQAAKAGQREVLRLLIERGANLNEPDGVGRTPLIACAEGDHVELAEMLHTAGANIERTGEGGRTALMECANSSSARVTKFLIERGANVNARREDGCTALHEAVFCACEDYQEPAENEIIPLLLAAGADIHLVGSDGLTPLGLAERYREENEIDYTDLLRGVRE